MTEWDNLWNEFAGPSVSISHFDSFNNWVKQVKAVGDKLQESNSELLVFLSENLGDNDLAIIKDKLHMYNTLMKPYTGEPFSVKDKHTWVVLKSVVTNERTKLLEQKLEAIKKLINDHPRNDYASSLINRIKKVLGE